MSEIYWKCSCGETFIEARSAFLHRDGSEDHRVKPERMERVSIPVTVPEPTVAEVRSVLSSLWTPPEVEAIREMLWSGRGWVEGRVYEDDVI